MNGFTTIKEKEMFILLTNQSIYPLAVSGHLPWLQWIPRWRRLVPATDSYLSQKYGYTPGEQAHIEKCSDDQDSWETWDVTLPFTDFQRWYHRQKYDAIAGVRTHSSRNTATPEQHRSKHHHPYNTSHIR